MKKMFLKGLLEQEWEQGISEAHWEKLWLPPWGTDTTFHGRWYLRLSLRLMVVNRGGKGGQGRGGVLQANGGGAFCRGRRQRRVMHCGSNCLSWLLLSAVGQRGGFLLKDSGGDSSERPQGGRYEPHRGMERGLHLWEVFLRFLFT